MPALAVGAVSVVRLQSHKGWTVLIAVAAVGVAFLVMLLWFIMALVFRWRFQFSIRSLLVLVVVVALPFSWLAVEMKAAKTQQGVADEIRKEGGVVWYDYQVDAHYNWSKTATLPEPPSLRKLLGDDFFTQADMVDLKGTGITDAGLEPLKRFETPVAVSMRHQSHRCWARTSHRGEPTPSVGILKEPKSPTLGLSISRG